MIIAFAMYSKFPMPMVEWDKKSLSWALCWFPLVGAAIGAVLLGWLLLARWLGLTALAAAGAVLLPIALSGGIHLDGFCDTCDALNSHQDRERKLEILKDSHTGAFAIICCALLLIVWFAAWMEVELTPGTAVVLSLLSVLSRAMSGTMAVTLPNARGTGLLATFTGPMDAIRARWVLRAWWMAVALAMLALGAAVGALEGFCGMTAGLLAAAAALLGATTALGYYRRVAMKQFGGTTGDLAGFFLCLCECAGVVCVALVQKLGGVV